MPDGDKFLHSKDAGNVGRGRSERSERSSAKGRIYDPGLLPTDAGEVGAVQFLSVNGFRRKIVNDFLHSAKTYRFRAFNHKYK